MSKSNKIIVVAISVTVALCVAVIGISSVMSTEKPTSIVNTENQPTSEAVTYETVPTAQPEADANGTAQSQQHQAGQTSENTASVTSETTTTAPSSVVEATQSAQYISTLIVGKWMDSAGMSGFEFFEDGKVSFTYVNLSSFNIPFDGTARNGIYTVEDNVVTIKFSIYTATIEKKYEVTIANDVLSMRDIDERETSTYTRQTASTQSGATTLATTAESTTAATTAAATVPQAVSGLEGSFLSGDKKNELTFNSDGTVEVKIKRDDFSGVYQITGNKLMIVYIDNGKSISEEYDYTLNGTILTLTSSKGEASVYVKQ